MLSLAPWQNRWSVRSDYELTVSRCFCSQVEHRWVPRLFVLLCNFNRRPWQAKYAYYMLQSHGSGYCIAVSKADCKVSRTKRSRHAEPMQSQKPKNIAGSSVIPTASQGGASYTVDASQIVLEFRPPDSPLDMALVKNIEQAYPCFAPKRKGCDLFHGLHVYAMNNVDGICMYLARALLYDSFPNQSQLRKGFRLPSIIIRGSHPTPRGCASKSQD